MAGHNKWSKVKHKKGVSDAKKSRVWTKIIREITVAARQSPDPSGNPRLRKALDDARSTNISKDTIDRAMARAKGDGAESELEELVYEGYGPSGVAMIVECTTDNRNRTIGDVRSIFNKNGGSLGASGSVRFGFKKLGQLYFDKEAHKGLSEDRLMEAGLESGLSDVSADEDSFVVTCAPEDFLTLNETFIKAGLKPSSADIEMVADAMIPVSGQDAKTVLKMIDALEDLDDVQNVWSNADIDDKSLEEFVK
jgi:YebC/PmpR family DNA-binding regulatory protein